MKRTLLWILAGSHHHLRWSPSLPEGGYKKDTDEGKAPSSVFVCKERCKGRCPLKILKTYLGKRRVRRSDSKRIVKMRFFQKSKENSNNNSRNGLKNAKECAILLKSLCISAFLKKGAAKNGGFSFSAERFATVAEQLCLFAPCRFQNTIGHL